MKYIVQVELDPDIGAEFEETPEDIQAWMGEWQKLNPIGMYFSMTRRRVTIIVDVLNEDGILRKICHDSVQVGCYKGLHVMAQYGLCLC